MSKLFTQEELRMLAVDEYPEMEREIDFRQALTVVAHDFVGWLERKGWLSTLFEKLTERREGRTTEIRAVAADFTMMRTSTTSGDGAPAPLDHQFRDREACTLESIHDELHAGSKQDRRPSTLALVGIGGVGKTTIALEYVQCFGHTYARTGWLSAGSSQSFAESARMACARWSSRSLGEDDVWPTLAMLFNSPDTFLVVDDAQESQDLLRLRQFGIRATILATSRDQTIVISPRLVAPFSMGDSLALLRELLPHQVSADSDLQRLATELGHLPIALSSAAAYIRDAAITIPAFLSLLKTHGPRAPLLAKRDRKPLLDALWGLSFERVSSNPHATALIRMLAFFDSPFPRALLSAEQSAACTSDKALQEALENPLLLNDALIALRRLGLLSLSADSIHVHNLIQEVVRLRVDDSYAIVALRTTMAMYRHITGTLRRRIVPHLLASINHVAAALSGLIEAVEEPDELRASVSAWVENMLLVCEELWNEQEWNALRALSSIGTELASRLRNTEARLDFITQRIRACGNLEDDVPTSAIDEAEQLARGLDSEASRLIWLHNLAYSAHEAAQNQRALALLDEVIARRTATMGNSELVVSKSMARSRDIRARIHIALAHGANDDTERAHHKERAANDIRAFLAIREARHSQSESTDTEDSAAEIALGRLNAAGMLAELFERNDETHTLAQLAMEHYDQTLDRESSTYAFALTNAFFAERDDAHEETARRASAALERRGFAPNDVIAVKLAIFALSDPKLDAQTIDLVNRTSDSVLSAVECAGLDYRYLWTLSKTASWIEREAPGSCPRERELMLEAVRRLTKPDAEVGRGH